MKSLVSEFLSIKEWLERGWAATAFLVDDSKYYLQENCASEILEVVQELIESQTNDRLTWRQLEYSKMRIIEGERILNQSRISADYRSDIYVKYRLTSRLYSSLGAIGAKYLEKNWNSVEPAVLPLP